VLERPALEYRSEWQVGCETAQFEIASDGACLMLLYRQPGLRQHVRLAHPIERGEPLHVADLIDVATRLLRVLPLGDRPAPVHVELDVAAAVDDHRPEGARQCPAYVETAARDEQRHVSQPQPVRQMRAQIKPLHDADASRTRAPAARAAWPTTSRPP